MDGYRIERWSVEQYMDDVHTQIIQPEQQYNVVGLGQKRL